MLRSTKLIAICLVTFLLITGCGTVGEGPVPPSSHPQPIAYQPLGKAIYTPIDINYAIDNPLEIIEIDVSEDPKHQRSYIQIKGLLDKKVEEEVNNSIKALFEQMLPYGTGGQRPPYRGIEVRMEGSTTINNSTIVVTPQFNSNNVLSVVASAWVMYQHPTHGMYFSTCETLNFDLNTGQTLKIADIFTNDVDSLEIVNKAIAAEIRRRTIAATIDYNFEHFSQVSPFKGIDQEQKFFLSPYGLNIILDYNNPEFDMGFSYNTVTISFFAQQGAIAITERFYNEQNNIFIKEPTTKRLLPDYQVNRILEREIYKRGDTDGYITVGYPEDLPESLINIMDSIRLDRSGSSQYIDKDAYITFVEQNIHSYRLGPYVNIASHIYTSGPNHNQWREVSYTYTLTGQLLTLDGLFKPGYDYRNLIGDALARAAQTMYGIEAVETGDLIEGLMFRLNDTEIFFVTQPLEWEAGQKHPLNFNLSYQEIGYENLNIFR